METGTRANSPQQICNTVTSKFQSDPTFMSIRELVVVYLNPNNQTREHALYLAGVIVTKILAKSISDIHDAEAEIESLPDDLAVMATAAMEARFSHTQEFDPAAPVH